MKIALAQLNYHIGNFEKNTQKMIDEIRKSKSLGVELLVFSELAISGYPPRDFLEFDDFINKCEIAVEEIAKECKDIAVIVGTPVRNQSGRGKPLFNAAVFIENGMLKQFVHKSLLPNYDIFDEYRYFESGKDFQIVNYKGLKIALTICEDIWDVDELPMYSVSPMDCLIKQEPDIMVNIAASPFHHEQAKIRKEVLKANSIKYNLPLLYVNHIGAQTELIFDGGSLVLDAKGAIINEANYFEEDFLIYDTEKDYELISDVKDEKVKLIHDALVLGLRNYFEKLGFSKVILGLSGGIDSAVTLVIAEKALGAENVYAVLLPSKFSSDHSVKDAKDLAENLGVKYDIIPVQYSVEAVEMALSPYFKDLPFGIAEENIQARIRGVLLMGLSNKFGYVLLNTSNKSEAAVGYGTLYGDMNGGLSVLGDVYKTDVFALARYINRDAEVIPVNTIVKPPSAELRPDQKDADSLPDYDILDKILFHYIEERKSPAELTSMGFEKQLVDRILKLVNTNEYKRYQTAPILRVSPKAFGMGRRMPIVAKYLS